MKKAKHRCISHNTARPKPVYQQDKTVTDSAHDNKVEKLHKALTVLLNIVKGILNFIFGIITGFFYGLFQCVDGYFDRPISYKIGWRIGWIINLSFHAICTIVGTIVAYLMITSYLKEIHGGRRRDG